MKLSDYAKTLGISYLTAWRHDKAGKIPYPTEQLPTGTVIVDYDPILRRICRGGMGGRGSRGGKTQRQPPFLPLLQELASTKKFVNRAVLDYDPKKISGQSAKPKKLGYSVLSVLNLLKNKFETLAWLR
ncbi:MAG: hypothetical protein ACSI46_05210 [Gloeotrichia echinulata DVL01]